MEVRSLPSRERGLKFVMSHDLIERLKVAPLAGARIEIVSHNRAGKGASSSLPSRERGLKFRRYTGLFRSSASLPSRERGLKYCTGYRGTRSRWSLPSRERGLKYALLDKNFSEGG